MSRGIKEVFNILIASVGGQGGLTLSRTIAIAAVSEGFSVRTGETLGMSQRFGSVTSFVRMGPQNAVMSPTFSEGMAHVMVGLELTESVRNLRYLSEGGKILAADTVKPPITASVGTARMPSKDELVGALTSVDPEAVIVPARKIAYDVGNPRAVNMVMLGVFNRIFGILSDDAVINAILTLLPGRRGETSVAAYKAGIKWAEENKVVQG